MNNKIKDLLKYGLTNIDEYIINTYEDLNYICFNIMQIEGKSFIKLSYYINNPSIGTISGLCVPKKYRNNGYASKILTFVENISIELGINELNIILENMDWRHNWYNKLGYNDNFHDTQLIITKNINI